MGELRITKKVKLAQRHPVRKLDKKEKRVAKAIMPLIERRTCSKHSRKKEKQLLSLVESQIVTRAGMFRALYYMGFEPREAVDTALNEVVPELIPKRTISEAWDMVADNLPLAHKAIEKAGLLRISGTRRDDAFEIVVERMFDTALYHDDDIAKYSTYLFSTVKHCTNIAKKGVSPVYFPQRTIDLIEMLLNAKRKEPGISKKELVKRLKLNKILSRVRKRKGTSDREFAELLKSKQLTLVDRLELWAKMRRPIDRIDPNVLFYAEGKADDEKYGREMLISDPTDEKTTDSPPDAPVFEGSLKELTKKLLKTLNPKEEEVLRMRFAIGYRNEKTLEECGEILKVCRERARQIEARALRKLRHPSRSKILKEQEAFME